MDAEKFDDLIRTIGTTRMTRLTALRGLVAGAAAAVTGITLASNGEAGKKQDRSVTKEGNNAGGGNANCPAGDGQSSGRIDLADFLARDTDGDGCVDFPFKEKDESGNVVCSCNVRACISANLKQLTIDEEETTCTVGALIAKGANDAKICTDPVSPCSPPKKNGKTPDISNITICNVTCCRPKTCADYEGKGVCGYLDDKCGGLTDFCGCPSDEGCTVDPEDEEENGTCDECPTLADCTAETCGETLGGDLYGCTPVECPDCPAVGICVEGTSPKQCPKNSGDEFSCKIADSSVGNAVCDVSDPNRPDGSVQVVCGDPNFCRCNATTCVIYDDAGTVVETKSKGQPITSCQPAPCGD